MSNPNSEMNNPPTDDLNLLLKSWPNLTQADLITAIRDYDRKSKSQNRRWNDRGGYYHRGRGQTGRRPQNFNSRMVYR